jgi:hypothetical protein
VCNRLQGNGSSDTFETRQTVLRVKQGPSFFFFSREFLVFEPLP